jgi:hypothetical protein
MTDRNLRRHVDERIRVHTFTVSAAMVGICLTVIGLLRIVTTIQKTDTITEDLLTIDAVLFFFSCLSSYGALCTRSIHRMHIGKHLAEYVFGLALVLMVAICGFITYGIALH